MQTNFGFDGLGYLTYKRTYSREIRPGVTEEFPDTVERILKACKAQLDLHFTSEEEDELRGYFFGMKASVAGRFLWQLGTKTVDKLGLMSLQNCAFTTINHPIRPFTWAMDALMLGSGVGYNIQKEFVYELPKAKRARIVRKDSNDADFIIPDSREGWVKLLERTLESHFITGEGFSFSTVCIRSAGLPIRGFGGVSSGAEPLANGILSISDLLNKRAGKKVRTIDCLDIMNILGSIVVSGNVRRSAQIALGDMDDFQFLDAKRWDKGVIPNWRAMSNNTVICNDITALPAQFWDGYDGGGEPYGLVNLRLSRTVGRLGEDRFPDPTVNGYNPCAEMSLSDYETCCLAEIFLPNIVNQRELSHVTRFMYLINKHSLRLPCHHPETEKVVHENMRMGIGISGYLQATSEQKSWLKANYEELRNLDSEYSRSKGWPVSVKLTTVKPSGTLSLLAGVTPGVHPGYSRFFLRRIRIANNSPLLPLLQANGYPIEPVKGFDGTDDATTMVASFPCQFPAGTVVAKDCTAIQQLEYVKELQTVWSDNAVSCTVYYRKEELPAIKDWLLANYNSSIKSVSFLLHNEHGFLQAPYEEIDEATYNELRAKVTPIDQAKINDGDIADADECISGHCPIK